MPHESRVCPLLSVITINRNNASGLRRTLASLSPLRDDSCVEFLFIDGASRDGSLQLAYQFYEPDRLISEPDGGLYEAMNKGLHLATGDWLLWLNSGDELIPACWPKLRSMLTHTSAQVLCGASEIIDHRSGRCLRVNRARPNDLPWGMVNHPSTLFWRKTVLFHHGYNLRYRISADRHLLVRLQLSTVPFEFTGLCLSRLWLGGISDQRLLARARDNLQVDLDTGLINRAAYRYGLLRHLLFLGLIRPLVLTIRWLLSHLGIHLPPLGAYAGPLGELRRDAFAGKVRS
jgi:glycosyltransferase involved in cell wall biosynthesis